MASLLYVFAYTYHLNKSDWNVGAVICQRKTSCILYSTARCLPLTCADSSQQVQQPQRGRFHHRHRRHTRVRATCIGMRQTVTNRTTSHWYTKIYLVVGLAKEITYRHKMLRFYIYRYLFPTLYYFFQARLHLFSCVFMFEFWWNVFLQVLHENLGSSCILLCVRRLLVLPNNLPHFSQL